MLKTKAKEFQTSFLRKMQQFPIIFILSSIQEIEKINQEILAFRTIIQQYISTIQRVLEIHSSETELKLSQKELKILQEQKRILEDILKILNKKPKYLINDMPTLSRLWHLFQKNLL